MRNLGRRLERAEALASSGRERDDILELVAFLEDHELDRLEVLLESISNNVTSDTHLRALGSLLENAQKRRAVGWRYGVQHEH